MSIKPAKAGQEDWGEGWGRGVSLHSLEEEGLT